MCRIIGYFPSLLITTLLVLCHDAGYGVPKSLCDGVQ